MAQVRIDLTGDSGQLIAQIQGVVAAIRDLERSAADVYAMRGDIGMVGLQREIKAANADLAALKAQLQSLGTATTSSDIINQFQGITREAKSAREAAVAFKNQLGSMGTLALSDDATRKNIAQPDFSQFLVGAKGSTQEIIAQVTGLDRSIKSAAESGNVLKRSLYAASDADGIYRVTNAQKQETAAVQETINRLGKLAAARAESVLYPETAKSPRIASAFGDIEPEMTGAVTNVKKGIAETEDAFTKVGFGLRHVVAIFDEAMRGQRGAMIASASALVRDTIGVETIIRGLVSPWGAVGAAGVAAAVAIGIAFEQAFQKMKATEEVQTSFAFKGGGTNPQQYAETAAMIDRIVEKTHEWTGTVRTLVEEVSKIPLAARGQVEALSEFGIALGQGSGEDPAKAIKPLIAAMDQGAEAAAKFIAKEYNITQATDGSNRSLAEQIAATKSSTQQWQILVDALQKNLGSLVELELKARETSNSWSTFFERLMLSAAASDGSAEANDRLAESFKKTHQPIKDATLAEIEATQAQRDFEAAINSANSSITRQADLLTQLNNALSRTAQTTAEAAGQQSAIAEVDKMAASPGEQNRHQIAMDNIDAEARKRQDDTKAQLKAAQDRAAEVLRTQTAKRVEGGADPLHAEIDATSSEEYIKAQQQIQDAQRNIAKENVEIAKDAQRAIIQNEMIGTSARIAAQQEVVRIAKQAAVDGTGTAREVAQEEIKLQSLIRQERVKTFQEARDNGRAEVELAKGNVSEIMAAYDKLRSAAQAAGMPKATFAQIDREEVRDLESAQQQAFSAETEFNSAKERLGTLQIAAEKARLAEAVAAHKMSKEQMASAEGDFTAKVMEENERRIQAELANDSLTQTQKEKLYEHLAELYEKDAELQQQAQEKVTQAVEAENKKREAIFTKTFDAIGSAGEKAIEGLFNRGETHKQVLHKFLQESVKSIGTGAASELSDVGGEKIGPMLGLSKEESHGGIGQVLGESLFKALGLQKEAPEDHAKQASDKMKQAADAQSKAAELQNKASENLLAASKALQEFAGKHGVPSSYGGGGGGGGDGGAVGSVGHKAGTPTPDFTGTPAQAQAAVTYSLDATGEKLKAYCATLVNESLEKAGVKGSGSGLASSFGPGSSFGTPVSPDQVRAGDVFYKGSSGWGDTGHVGFTEGPVSGGQVPVMSSHMQGDPSNPAGSEYRSITGMTFRRPAYDESQTSQQNTVKLDPSSAQTVSQGVVTGEQQAAQTTQSAIDQGVQQGNSALISSNQTDKTAVDANKAALDKNTTSVDKNTTKISAPGGGGGGTGDSASGTSSALNVLKETTSAASSGLSILGGRFGAIGNAINRGMSGVTQLTSVVKSASEGFDLMDGTTKAVTTATTLEQGAKTLNATATATDTTAMQTNAAAAASSGGGGILGGLFKLFAFSGGGVVPSAAGGMMVGGGAGGTLSLLHPQEMVLPAHLSQGLQGMINRGGDNSSSNTVLNYNANVTGYHPYGNRSEFEGMLRSNSSAMMDFVRNEMRNGSYR